MLALITQRTRQHDSNSQWQSIECVLDTKETTWSTISQERHCTIDREKNKHKQIHESLKLALYHFILPVGKGCLISSNYNVTEVLKCRRQIIYLCFCSPIGSFEARWINHISEKVIPSFWYMPRSQTEGRMSFLY